VVDRSTSSLEGMLEGMFNLAAKRPIFYEGKGRNSVFHLHNIISLIDLVFE
jgi:hypothetical protein